MGGSRTSSVSSQPVFEQPMSKPPVDDDLGFDVDELVKKIDAKIAELEEEERRNKQAASENKTTTKAQPIINKPVAVPKTKPVEPAIEETKAPVSSLDEFLNAQPTKVEETPTIKPLEEKVVEPINSIVAPKENLVLADDESDDDDFFDDFFDN